MLISKAAPPPSLIEDIIMTLRSTSPPIAQSVAVFSDMSGNSKYFPLWTIMYWKELNYMQHWVQGDCALQQLCAEGCGMVELVNTVGETLSHLH
jgi:hypothetical protein